MDRLTTNKPVGEMTMTELAHNGCYVGENGWARYRDYDTDIDARDLARMLLERYEPEQPLPEDNRALEEFLYDELQCGASDHAGALVALMYNMIWSMADLRERLAAYEDTGLKPEEIKNGIFPPCKVGDTLYVPTRDFVSTFQVTHFEIYDSGVWVSWKIMAGITGNFRFDGIPGTDIGKTVFLTREEAEASLGGDGDGK